MHFSILFSCAPPPPFHTPNILVSCRRAAFETERCSKTHYPATYIAPVYDTAPSDVCAMEGFGRWAAEPENPHCQNSSAVSLLDMIKAHKTSQLDKLSTPSSQASTLTDIQPFSTTIFATVINPPQPNTQDAQTTTTTNLFLIRFASRILNIGSPSTPILPPRVSFHCTHAFVLTVCLSVFLSQVGICLSSSVFCPGVQPYLQQEDAIDSGSGVNCLTWLRLILFFLRVISISICQP